MSTTILGTITALDGVATIHEEKNKSYATLKLPHCQPRETHDLHSYVSFPCPPEPRKEPSAPIKGAPHLLTDTTTGSDTLQATLGHYGVSHGVRSRNGLRSFLLNNVDRCEQRGPAPCDGANAKERKGANKGATHLVTEQHVVCHRPGVARGV